MRKRGPVLDGALVRGTRCGGSVPPAVDHTGASSRRTHALESISSDAILAIAPGRWSFSSPIMAPVDRPRALIDKSLIKG